MLDPKYFRQELEETTKLLARRGYKLDSKTISDLEERRKSVQVKTQDLQAMRNSKSKGIGKAKAQGEDIQPLLDEVASLGDELKAAETELQNIQTDLDAIIMGVPNLPHESVPDGKDENDNVEIRTSGEKPNFVFEIKDPVDLGEQLGQLDFETAEQMKYSANRTHTSFAELKRAHDSSYDRAFREFRQVLQEYEDKTGITF